MKKEQIPSKRLSKLNYGWNYRMEWKSSLHRLETISVKRCIKPDYFGGIIEASLHCFSDASYYGYGQVTYIRLVNCNKEISVSLIMANSIVSPLKPTTVPRLELIAALLSCNVGALQSLSKFRDG